MVFLLVDVFRVFGSGFFWHVCSWAVCLFVFFFLGLIGDVFRVFCSAYPPRSVSGLVRVIGPLIRGTGHVSRVVGWASVFLDIFRVIFSSRFFRFTFHFSMHLPRPPLRG